MPNKIIILENQSTQFNTLSAYLRAYTGASFDIPNKLEYKELMNAVKVYINEDYTEDYKEKAGRKIKEIIEKKQPEIVIIDFKIGGSSRCMNGVKLASDLFELFEGQFLFPILFLSRIDHDEKVYSECFLAFEKNYKDKIALDRMRKSYTNDKTLNRDYVMRVIAPKIKELINKQQSLKIITILQDAESTIGIKRLSTDVGFVIQELKNETEIRNKELLVEFVGFVQEGGRKYTDELSKKINSVLFK